VEIFSRKVIIQSLLLDGNVESVWSLSKLPEYSCPEAHLRYIHACSNKLQQAARAGDGMVLVWVETQHDGPFGLHSVNGWILLVRSPSSEHRGTESRS